jgi:hypothetical protein
MRLINALSDFESAFTDEKAKNKTSQAEITSYFF